MNKVTDDFGVDINSELTRKKRDICVKYVLTLCSSSGILTPDAQTLMSSALLIRLTGSVGRDTSGK